MAAYFIVDVEAKNPQAYEAYKQAAAESIAQHGGRYLVRGGTHEVLEGTGARRASWWVSQTSPDALTPLPVNERTSPGER